MLEKSVRSLSRISDTEMSAEFGQVLIFTMTLAGIDLVAHQIQTVYNNNIPNASVLQQLSTASAEQILEQWSENLSSSDFAAGLGSGLAVQTAVKGPTMVLSALIANPATHKQLSALLSRSILSTSILVGWSFGSQLATEARYLIQDPADYARAASFTGVSVGALSSILNPASDNLRDRRVAGLMFANVLQVVFVQQDLRDQWFNNTWRTKIMTGEFATMVGSMIAAGTIGTAIFPGAGTVAGAMFGVAGAVVYIAIPNSFKNSITLELQGLREQCLAANLNGNERALVASFQTTIIKLPPMMGQAQYNTLNRVGQLRLPDTVIPDEQRIAKLQKALTSRHLLRDSDVTILLERAHLLLQQYFSRQLMFNEATRALNSDFDSIDALYANDLRILQSVLPAGEVNVAMVTLIANETQRIRSLREFFAELQAPLIDSIGSMQGPAVNSNLSDDAQTVVQFVQISYARAFTEDKILGGT